MAPTALPIDKPSLRGLDTNSLLRLYDRARLTLDGGQTAWERDRAAKACDRITRELRKRGIRP